MGRTLIVKDNDELNYIGKQNVIKTNNNNTFVEFDNYDNAKNALDDLKNKNIRCKYSYYKLFFRMNNINLNNITYDDLKELIKSELLKNFPNIGIIGLRFNRVDDNFTGTGDITVDLKNDFDTLLNYQLSLTENGSIVFYKFKPFRKYKQWNNRR